MSLSCFAVSDMNEGHPGHIYITGLSHADAKKAIS